MRLRPFIAGSLVLALLLGGMRLLYVIDQNRQAADIMARQQQARALSMSAARLFVVTQDYLLHGNDRAASQWALLHRELAQHVDALRQLSVTDPAVDEMTEALGDLEQLFASLKRASAMPPGAQRIGATEVANAQIVQQLREINDHAHGLSVELDERQRQLQVNQSRSALVFTSLLVALLCTVLLYSWHRLLRPLRVLEQTAQAVSRGERNARVMTSHRDELGDAASAINRMLDELAASLETQRQARERMQSILEGTNVGTWEWNVQTGETRFNERWAEIIGHRLEDLMPVSIDTWMAHANSDDLAESSARLQAHFSGLEPYYECEARMRHRDGHWVWVLDRGRLRTRTPQGEPEWMFGTHQDISDRKCVEIELRQARDAANTANRAKSEFLANISHEIRTPLNAVLGMHRLLERSHLDEDQRTMLHKADTAGHGLLDLINDVLDLAKIESGEMRIDPQPFELRELLDELTTVFETSARAKSIELRVQCDDRVAPWVLGDRLRMRQVLFNLLGNAIKFTETGGVRLQVRPGQDDGSHLNFSVLDSGIGMDEATVAGLFRPFTQADSSTTRRYGGTGLGLSIVRHLCGLMQGTVNVQSTPGKGSSFVVDLPLPAVPEHEVQHLARLRRPLTIGIGPGIPEVRARLALQMHSMGWQTLPLEAGAHDPRVDARVVWAGEPMSTGTPDSPPEVMAEPDDPAITIDRLVQQFSLRAHLHDRLLSAARRLPAGSRWLEGLHLLVVDDNLVNLEIAAALIKAQGAICTTAIDGQAAIDELFGSARAIDAVLMDIQMPRMDGLEATRLIRAHPGTRPWPIVALTAGALQSERERALAAGFDGFLTKPIDLVALVRTLRCFIVQRQQRPLGVRLVPEPLPEDGLSAQAAWPAIAGIDLPSAMNHTSNSLPLFARLLLLLREGHQDWSRRWHPLQEPLPDESIKALTASLHKLAGSAGTLGAHSLAACAMRAERVLIAPEATHAERAAAVSEVALELDVLMDAIDAWRDSPDALPREPGRADDEETDQMRPRLIALRDLLLRHDLDALPMATGLARGLQRVMGKADADQILAAVERLDFESAIQLLDQVIGSEKAGAAGSY